MMIASCKSQQSKAMKDQQKAMDVLSKHRDADAVNTTANGWTMTATINGKPWKANFMYHTKSTGRIIGHFNEEFISFPFSKQKMIAGKKITIKQGYVADLFLKDGTGIWDGDKGEINITSVKGKWVEATFNLWPAPLPAVKQRK